MKSAWLAAALLCSAPAGAQVLPRELLDPPTTYIQYFAEPSRSSALAAVEAARAAFRNSDLDGAAAALGSFDGVSASDLAGFAGVGPGEASVIRSLELLLAGKRAAAYRTARTVVDPGARVTGLPRREAALVMATALLQSEIMAPAYGWAEFARRGEPAIPLAESLAKELRGSGLGEPAPATAVPHPSVPSSSVETWRGPDSSHRPLTLAYLAPDGDFLGALVLERYLEKSSASMPYRVSFRDLDGADIYVREGWKTRPSEAEIRAVGDLFTPVARSTGDGSAYSPLRREFEVAAWHREQVWPLAAWWSALGVPSGSATDLLVQDLRKQRAWDWKPASRKHVDLPAEDDEPRGVLALGFRNLDADRSLAAKDWAAPLEHYHFVVTNRTGRHKLSYAVSSRAAPEGARSYVLEKVADGRRTVLQTFPAGFAPTFESVEDAVSRLLEKLAAMDDRRDSR